MPTGGKFTINSNGKLGLRSSGKADVCDDCCDIELGDDCDECDSDTTPLKVQLEFDGIVVCSGVSCFYTPHNILRTQNTTFSDMSTLLNPNSTFELEQSPSPYYSCFWSLSSSLSSYTFWSDDGGSPPSVYCDAQDGSVNNVTSFMVKLEISTYAGTTSIRVQLYIHFQNAGILFRYFDGTNTSVTAPIDCLTEWPVITNNNLTCAASRGASSAWNGSEDNTGTCTITAV